MRDAFKQARFLHLIFAVDKVSAAGFDGFAIIELVICDASLAMFVTNRVFRNKERTEDHE